MIIEISDTMKTNPFAKENKNSLEGVSSPIPKTFTKPCDFFYSFYDLNKCSIPYLRPNS